MYRKRQIHSFPPQMDKNTKKLCLSYCSDVSSISESAKCDRCRIDNLKPPREIIADFAQSDLAKLASCVHLVIRIFRDQKEP